MNKQLVDTNGREPMKTLSGNVTTEIKNNAARCSLGECMVAVAIKQKHPEATSIFVDGGTLRLTLNGLRYWFITPQSVKNYIVNYDKYGAKAIKPFKFVAPFRARVTPAGLYETHPNWDNSKRSKKRYNRADKRRKYPTKRVRINGYACTLPA